MNGRMMPLGEGSIAVEDRGFIFGDGVYEVIRILNGRLLWPDAHLIRLRRSLAAIHMSGVLVDPLSEVVERLVREAHMTSGWVYIQITRGATPRDFALPDGAEPTVLAFCRATEPWDADPPMRGISVHPVEDLRWSRCDIKSTSLLGAVLAKEEARRHGAEEVAFVSPDGLIREGGSSNIFFVVEGALRTHPLGSHILAGVTRAAVLRASRARGIVAKEEAVRMSEIAEATEAFITSTARDLVPVCRFGTHDIELCPGPLTRALGAALRSDIAAAVGLIPVPPV